MSSQIFTNLDKLVHYGNELDGGATINVFYSTPEAYAQAKSAEGTLWSVKTDDFFPYADSSHAYWTGYFSSRPLLKRLERVTSGFLQAARQLEALFSPTSPLYGYSGGGSSTGGSSSSSSSSSSAPSSYSPLGRLEAAQAVNQHHDAVSGTAKQHVTLDYAQRMSDGVNEAWAEVVVNAFNNATSTSTSAQLDWQYCPLLNESACGPAALASSSSSSSSSTSSSASASSSSSSVLAVSAYNPLVLVRSGQVLRVPTSTAPVDVTNAETGESLVFQVA
jgi:hypothetical protein